MEDELGTLIDLTGRRFERLVVEGRGPDRIRPSGRGQEPRWWCRCDCGNRTLVSGHNLRGGNTRSCGCIHQEVVIQLGHTRGGQGKIPNDGGDKNRALRTYQRHAKDRNIPFELTKGEFCNLITQPCYYCGKEPNNIAKRGYKYQGIDRLDNKKGYTLDNVVPCCKDCNRAKADMELNGFIAWIKAIASRFI